MKKAIVFTTAIWAFLALTQCTKKESTSGEVATATVTEDAENHTLSTVTERKSASSLDSLSIILIDCLKNNDKKKYISYCFSEDQETALSALITDKAKQKRFVREFGFSLHEEVYYYENLVKYIEKVGIDLNLIDKSLIEVIDYNKSNYAPIELKEVIIPVIQEGLERDIVYVGVNIDGRWYFTSELSM